MSKKIIALMLILIISFVMTTSVFAHSWSVSDTSYGSVAGDITTAGGIVSLVCGAVGYGGAGLFTALGTALFDFFGKGPFNVYYKTEVHTSPDGYAYYLVTTFYKNANYTGQIDIPVTSEIFYITCSPSN